MPFRTSQRRVNSCLRSSKVQADSCQGLIQLIKLKSMLILHSEDPRILRNYTKSILILLYKWNNKTWMMVHLFTTCSAEYFKTTVETYCSGEKKKFKMLLLNDNAPGQPRTLIQIHNQIQVFFIPANTHNIASILQSTDQGVMLTFQS